MTLELPQTCGNRMAIQLDCCDSLDSKIAEFFIRSSQAVVEVDDHKRAREGNRQFQGIRFDLNVEATS